jgi:pantothenate kinase
VSAFLSLVIDKKRETLTPCSWFVSVSRAIAKQRLIKRHLLAGIETSVEAAAARVEKNDLLNGDLITKKMIAPDLIVEGVHVKHIT